MTNQRERELLARIATEPGKMGGKPVIRGRRITPAMVLKMLAGGATRAEPYAGACPAVTTMLRQPSIPDGEVRMVRLKPVQ